MAASVYVFPIPGSRYNRPETQITLRGVSSAALGRVSVVGSLSGVHSGRIEADSDGDGASFLPDEPFVATETVTVTTRLHIFGSRDGEFTFAIADVAAAIRTGTITATPGPVDSFRSRPDLRPAVVVVSEDEAPASEGDIFVAPQTGPVQDGPMILDPTGRLVWFLPYPVQRNVFVNDFRVADLYGRPVLTWWEGVRDEAFGQSSGVGVIYDREYRRIATVRAGDGLGAGSHEFLITPGGDAFITASSPVRLAVSREETIDSVVQEIDIRTGLVLFEWSALDHVPLRDSYISAQSPPLPAFDPYHVNSISVAPDGDVLVSMRNTCAVYLIDHRTGRILWTLGGKDSSFRMGPRTRTAYQHDATMQPDGTVTIFDNGGGLPFVHAQSRGIHERLDLADKTTSLIAQYEHSPPLLSSVQGSVQLLPDGNAFVGWGAVKFFSEYNAAGRQIFDAHFAAPVPSYRAFRYNWNAQPTTKPALALSPHANDASAVYASWNGATDVSSWQVLAGSGPNSLTTVGSAPKSGFETEITVHSNGPYFAVRALGANGHVLATSNPTDIANR
jgi:Arylsulfotransferase (ASST)